MLWILLVVLMVFWVLGMGPLSIGPFIHVLIVIALIVFILQLVGGRSGGDNI